MLVFRSVHHRWGGLIRLSRTPSLSCTAAIAVAATTALPPRHDDRTGEKGLCGTWTTAVDLLSSEGRDCDGDGVIGAASEQDRRKEKMRERERVRESER